MTNSYLLEVIKALQPEEREEIGALLSIPTFNRSGNAKELVKLYQVILDTAPEFLAHLLHKNEVYGRVFSELTPVPGKLEKLTAELNKLLRKYALTKQYQADDNEVRQQIDWAKWLRMRGLAERARQVGTKLADQKGKPESLEKYQEALLISEEKYFWEGTHNQLKGDLGIPDLIYALELYYQNYKSELTNRYLLQQKGTQLPDLGWANEKADYWQTESILLLVSIGINKILRKSPPVVEEFQDLMQLLQSKGKLLSFQTLAQLYAYLRNTCTLLIDGGNFEFVPILHEIHKDNLERQYFFINGELSPNAYLNLVQVAIRAKECDWARKFTETFKNRLIGGDEDHFFYKTNLAHCLFAEGFFSNALEALPDTPSGTYYHHMIRRLEIKLLFEINSDLLLYKIDAFRKFVERTAPKVIAEDYRIMDINFVNIVLQLTQSPPKDKSRSAKLLERIEGKKLIADRAWLLEKARELG